MFLLEGQANQTNHSHSPSHGSSAFFTTTEYICGFVYIPFLILVVLFTIWQFIQSRTSCCANGDNLVIFSKDSLNKICGVLLSIVFGVRVIWFFMMPAFGSTCYIPAKGLSAVAVEQDVFWCAWMRFLNRLDMLLQMTAVFLILTAWMLGLGGGSMSRARNNRLRMGFAAINLVFYVVVFATAFSIDRVVYAVNSFIIAGTALVASVAMLVIGLTCVARRLQQMTRSSLVQRQFLCVIVVTIVCMLSYLMRTACFVYGALYSFLTIPNNTVVYPWLFYPVPDICIGGAIVGLLLCQPRSRNQRKSDGSDAALPPGVMAAANAYAAKKKKVGGHSEQTRLLD